MKDNYVENIKQTISSLNQINSIIKDITAILETLDIISLESFELIQEKVNLIKDILI